MPDRFGGQGRSTSRFDRTPAPSSGFSFTGAVKNFGSDIKDAVVGLPAGMVELARNPIKSLKAIGAATWQTWSPLYHGEFRKFGGQLYDHPLAPMLDVLTVFSLGTAGAARGASALSKAGVQSSKIEKVASLRVPKALDLPDPTGQGRPALTKNLSTRPGRRTLQEAQLVLEPLLPEWGQKTLSRTRYEWRHTADVMHRVAAKNLMVQTTVKAAEALSDPETAPHARKTLAASLYLNVLRHGHKVAKTDDLMLPKHRSGAPAYGFVRDARFINRQAAPRLRRLRRQEAKWDRRREANAELAHALPRIQDELGQANQELAELHRSGGVIALPASGTAAPTSRQIMEQQAAPILDAERRVKDLETRLNKAHTAKADHEKALSHLEQTKALRMDAETRGWRDYFERYSGDDFEQKIAGDQFARDIVTTKLDEAALDAEGRVTIVPMHDLKNLQREAANSHAFLKWLWRKPTSVWKMLQIGYTPRTITNNAVGNWFLYAMRELGDVEGTRALWDAYRLTKGEAAAAESMMRATPFKRNNWLYQNFGDELGNVFGQVLSDTPGVMPRKLAQGLYPLVHKTSDEPVRIAAIAAHLRRSPEVKRLMKEKGLDFDSAVTRALRKDRSLRDRAAEHARAVAGDYFTVRGIEGPIRDLMPFYLWNRHILRTSGNLLLDTPGRVALMQRVSNMGVERMEELLGELPEFLHNAIPLSMLGLGQAGGGRADVLTTWSLNPFATVGDLAGFAQGLTVGGGPRAGSEVLQQANPLLTGFIEWATGRSILTGGPKPSHGGAFSSVLANLGAGLPFVRLIQAGVTPDATAGPSGKDFLYAKDDRSPLTSLFGIPLRDVSLDTAHALRQRDDEEREPKRKKRSKTDRFG